MLNHQEHSPLSAEELRRLDKLHQQIHLLEREMASAHTELNAAEAMVEHGHADISQQISHDPMIQSAHSRVKTVTADWYALDQQNTIINQKLIAIAKEILHKKNPLRLITDNADALLNRMARHTTDVQAWKEGLVAIKACVKEHFSDNPSQKRKLLLAVKNLESMRTPRQSKIKIFKGVFTSCQQNMYQAFQREVQDIYEKEILRLKAKQAINDEKKKKLKEEYDDALQIITRAMAQTEAVELQSCLEAERLAQQKVHQLNMELIALRHEVAKLQKGDDPIDKFEDDYGENANRLYK